MNCKQCTHKQNPNGGHCYMFREQPSGTFCAQFNASDTIRSRVDVLRSLNLLLGSKDSVDGVVEHLTGKK